MYICSPFTTGLGSPLAFAAAGSIARSMPTQKKLHSAISRTGPPVVVATASGLARRPARPAIPAGTARLVAMKSRRVNLELALFAIGFDLTRLAPLESVCEHSYHVQEQYDEANGGRR